MKQGLILIVDDEPRVLQAWERCLRLAGHIVRTARTAEQALHECDEHSFDVIVLDFIMPGMTGLELLARMRKILPFVRCVMVSGKLDDELQESSVLEMLRESVEADVYLHKPVSNDKLRETVLALISRSNFENWTEVASKAVDAQTAKMKAIKEAAKRIKSLKKKKKR